MLLAKMDSIGLTEDYLFDMIKTGIESAMVEGPKSGTLVEDRKARVQLINLALKSRKIFKSDTVINILNALGKSDTLY